MKINILGTGYGMALECYNTCFTIERNGKHFLVDSGGGNTILKNLKSLNISIEDIETIFISHSHIDHILGSLWIIRALLPKYHHKKIDRDLIIYGNESVVLCLRGLINTLMPKDFLYLIDNKIKLKKICDNEKYIILGKEITFFDIQATKSLQYGFFFNVEDNKKFTFIGDECCSKNTQKYVLNSTWLFADAYMCGKEADEYNPIEKHCHSTVKYISIIANELNVKKLILSHTIDTNINNRQKSFKIDAQKYFNGEILIPNDLDVILLSEEMI